ncbi:MAG TPA: HEAT repeat domain-containing protein [Gemmatimonadaceae bacterium]
MEYSLTVARHFAQLVWLLLNEASAYDTQLATLRLLTNATKDGSATITTREWRLLVNGTPAPDAFPGAQALVTQLIGHTVTELKVERGATLADLIFAARMLACDPLPGDRGRTISAGLRALDVRTVRMTVAASGTGDATAANAAATATPGTAAAPTAAPSEEPAIPGLIRDVAMPLPLSDEEREAEEMLQSLANVETPKGSMFKLLEQLDAAKTSPAIGAQLAGLVKLALESAHRERMDVVADIFAALVQREKFAPDGPLRRHLAIAIRRLSVSPVLRCITALLPQRMEDYERFLPVFARTEEEGVEALVDALISAPSIAYRRIYFDTLMRLGTGARALIHMLGDSRWFAVRNAAELLGEMGVKEAEPELTKLLDHPDDRVRAAAAGALTKLGSSAAARGVRDALRDAHDMVREHAVEAVQGRGGAHSVGSLIRAINQDDDHGVQMAMLTALARIGTPAAVEKLVSIANSDGGLFKRTPIALRVAAVRALGEVQSPVALEALQSLLRADQKEVRGAASWVMMGKKRRDGET